MPRRLRHRAGGGGEEERASSRSDSGSVAARRRRGDRDLPPDPLRLSGELFEYVTHAEQHGEAFVGYRVRGRAMVLCSSDGTALASLHLRPAGGGRGGGGKALIARRPDDNSSFLGILTKDGQAFTLVMTNLTTDGVLMMDVGGELRAQEPAFWDKKDKTFWSGRHRNDARLNRSNILWPMAPNVCEQSFLHYQQTGESRQLCLRAQSAAAAGAAGPGGEPSTVNGAEGCFPIYVYPKHGGRGVARFARTTWECPESIVVVGTPALLDGATEEYNIQLEHPLARMPGGGGEASSTHRTGWEAVVEALAGGIPVPTFLEIAGLDPRLLEQLPDDRVCDIVTQQLARDDIRAALDEYQERHSSPGRAAPGSAAGAAAAAAAEQQPAEAKSPSLSRGWRSGPSPGGSGSRGPPSPAAAGAHSSFGSLAADAKPADVVAGRRVLEQGAHRLLIQRFDFHRPSAPAALRFGVHEKLQLRDEGPLDAEEAAELKGDLERRIAALRSGRREALLERICSVFLTTECVICLGSDPGPDAVLYQCGHKCVHLACVERERLRRCPICRAPISAILPE